MSRKEQAKVIDGHSYKVTQFPTTESLRVWTKLVKLAGPSIAELGGSMEGDGLLEANLDPSALGSAVKALADQLEEDEVVAFIQRLLSFTKVDGSEINWELHFQGRLAHLFRLLGFVLEVNYGDFLGALDVAKAGGLQAIGGQEQEQEDQNSQEAGAA